MKYKYIEDIALYVHGNKMSTNRCNVCNYIYATIGNLTRHNKTSKHLNNLSKLENAKKTGAPEINSNNSKKARISKINSNTAKNGYKEEQLICNDINNNIKLRISLEKYLGINYGTCSRVKGTTKSDIRTDDMIFMAQVKKYKKGQFQQLDRHWIKDLIKTIDGLETIEQMLKNLCECPLLADGIHVDKKSIKKLCTYNYSTEDLEMFIKTFNENKKQILEFAFFGKNPKLQPRYLIGAEYEKNECGESKRCKMVLFDINDIISYLMTQKFSIRKSKTVIELGNEGIITIQRKGGDSGKKSSNQYQIKIIVSKLVNLVNHFEHIL